jgi:O-antigen/teichoic acid export membrane protein
MADKRPLSFSIYAKFSSITLHLRDPSVIVVVNAAAQSFIRLCSNIILARLLTPTAFALTSITMLVLTGVQMVSDIGIAMLALRRGPMSVEDEARLWTMQFVRGIGIGLFVLAVSQPLTFVYGNPKLGNVLRVLSLMPMLQGAQSLYPVMALARRNLLPSLVIDVGGRLVGALASVMVAFISPTVWALVAGTLVNFVLNVFVSFAMSGRRPQFVFDFTFIQEQWRFSRWIQVSSTLSFLGMQIDKALFPLLFGLPAFGLYSIGATFAVIPSQITQKWSASVYYPLIVQLLHGDEQARSELRRVRMTMLLYSAVATIVMIPGAECFFAVFYKPAYYQAGRFAALLAAGSFFEVGESSLRHFPLVDDTPRYEVLAVVVRLFAFAILVSSLRDGGVYGYALSYVGALFFSYIFMLIVCVRRRYLSMTSDLAIAFPIAAVVMGSYLWPMAMPSWTSGLYMGAVIAVSGGLLIGFIYRAHGLPSLASERAKIQRH